MLNVKTSLILVIFALFAVSANALAQEQDTVETCPLTERHCIMTMMQGTAGKIDNPGWRDQTYRELAKTLAFDGHTDEAIALIDKIDNPDTKAMAIRGIGMTVADNKLTPEAADAVFTKLHESAKKITHAPSFAIALTYIAMGQAFAGDNEGAWATAAGMENEALRNKAYGETAEIQAERKDFAAAMTSIEKIVNPSYRDKAYATIAKILADNGMLEESIKAGMAIKDNNYMKSQALQYLLDVQKPREIDKEKL